MSDNQVHEEQKAGLLEDESRGPAVEVHDEDNVDDMDAMRPSSSRVKKVLYWDSMHREFEMDEKHKKDLRKYHITNE